MSLHQTKVSIKHYNIIRL